MLKEVRYLEMRTGEGEELPSEAAAVYSKNETYRKYLANLDLIVAWYNEVRETVLDVEFPLIADQLEKIDSQLEQSLTTLTWAGEGTYVQLKNHVGLRSEISLCLSLKGFGSTSRQRET